MDHGNVLFRCWSITVKKKLRNFNLTKNFAENAKQAFSSFKKYGKHKGFKQI